MMSTSVAIRQSSLPSLRSNNNHSLLKSARLFLGLASAPLISISASSSSHSTTNTVNDNVGPSHRQSTASTSDTDINRTHEFGERNHFDLVGNNSNCSSITIINRDTSYSQSGLNQTFSFIDKHTIKQNSQVSEGEIVFEEKPLRKDQNNKNVDKDTYDGEANSVGSVDINESLKEVTDISNYSADQHTHSSAKKKLRGKKGKRKQKNNKKAMRNKSNFVDLPSVTKSASGLMPNKTTNISLNFRAQCSAVKMHRQPRSPQNMSEKMVKNGDGFKSVYVGSPYEISAKSCQSSSLSVTSQRLGRVSVNDFAHSSAHSISPQVSLSRRSMLQHANDMYMKKITKIYQSQSQSGTVVVCGVELPCAPPATPTPEQLQHHQYIPSLNDVMAQRAIKLRLEKLEKKEQKKQDKKREEEMKVEKLSQKDKLFDKRRKQRLEIYALNKIMTELENKKFLEFCHSKGIS